MAQHARSDNGFAADQRRGQGQRSRNEDSGNNRTIENGYGDNNRYNNPDDWDSQSRQGYRDQRSQNENNYGGSSDYNRSGSDYNRSGSDYNRSGSDYNRSGSDYNRSGSDYNRSNSGYNGGRQDSGQSFNGNYGRRDQYDVHEGNRHRYDRSAGAGQWENGSHQGYGSNRGGYDGQGNFDNGGNGRGDFSNREQRFPEDYGNQGYDSGRSSSQWGTGRGSQSWGNNDRHSYGSYDRPEYGRNYGSDSRAMGSAPGWNHEGQGEHRGRGPKGYQRSDERIREDVCDRLADHSSIDASDIEIKVSGSEVILTGSVDRKEDKRRAEDIAESISGVTNVQNQLRVGRGSAGTQSTTSRTGTSETKTNKTASTDSSKN